MYDVGTPLPPHRITRGCLMRRRGGWAEGGAPPGSIELAGFGLTSPRCLPVGAVGGQKRWVGPKLRAARGVQGRAIVGKEQGTEGGRIGARAMQVGPKADARVVGEGEEAPVESPVVKGIQGKAIARVCAVGGVGGPRPDVACH